MRTVDDVLRMAKSAGVTVLVEGYDLVLEHEADPPPNLVATLRHYKPELVSALRMRQADQRSLITQWVNDHFASSPPGVCAHCGDGHRPEDPFVLLFVGNDRGEVHASCHPAWRKAREAEARRALGLSLAQRVGTGNHQTQGPIRNDARPNTSQPDDDRASLAPAPFVGPHQSRATLAGDSASSETRQSTMRISGAFPSPYLKAADLQGRRVPVKILRVEMQDFGDEAKPVVYFEGKSKGLVLNKTNANTISDAYGDETEHWEGKETVLYEAEVEYQGRRMPGIRCIVPSQRKPQKPTDEVGPDDDIPF